MQLSKTPVTLGQAPLHPRMRQRQHHRSADHPGPGQHRAPSRRAHHDAHSGRQPCRCIGLPGALRAPQNDGGIAVGPDAKARLRHGLGHLEAVPGLFLGGGVDELSPRECRCRWPTENYRPDPGASQPGNRLRAGRAGTPSATVAQWCAVRAAFRPSLRSAGGRADSLQQLFLCGGTP